MPGPFLASFAARLAPRFAPEIALARQGAAPRAGRVSLAPGGRHLTFTGRSALRVQLAEGPPVSGHQPSIDAMFRSAVPFGERVSAVLLTGMGRDGAAGLAELREAGARTFAQTEASCVIFGMPRVAGELGAVQHWAAPEAMAELLLGTYAQSGGARPAGCEGAAP